MTEHLKGIPPKKENLKRAQTIVEYIDDGFMEPAINHFKKIKEEFSENEEIAVATNEILGKFAKVMDLSEEKRKRQNSATLEMAT